MAKECGAERTKYGVRSVCVRPVGHHGDHTSQAGNRWAGETPSKLATMPDVVGRKTPEAWTLEDVIANIKDRLSVDVRVSRTDYEDSSNTVRVTLKWDNVAFSETSDTIPTE